MTFPDEHAALAKIEKAAADMRRLLEQGSLDAEECDELRHHAMRSQEQCALIARRAQAAKRRIDAPTPLYRPANDSRTPTPPSAA